MTANREYKDSVFSWLFSNPDTLRELYSALSGKSLPPETPIVINTLLIPSKGSSSRAG
ncbi:MAG: hypothetical protein LBU28_08045 [Spirochaetaceae bacterium]|jgi:hypothetical protein|nr:hypothetical protein [Spirochaetaceae bacterium]